MRLRFDCNCLVCVAVVTLRVPSVCFFKAPLADCDRKLMTLTAAADGTGPTTNAIKYVFERDHGRHGRCYIIILYYNIIIVSDNKKSTSVKALEQQ